jgi:alpha-glucoside transport system substrate-binding protein
VQFSEDERVDRLIEFLVSPDGSREWARRGGYLSARTSVDVDEYYDGIDQRFADLLLEDRVERFDASDSMPPDIGSALFWTEITKWIRGSTTLEEFLATMDEARAAR